jgi:hypothetical protein
MDIFEIASKKKTRFATTRGVLASEDLWALSLENLDSMARALNKQIKDLDEESFINKKSTASTELNLQFAIIKRVIEVKLEEADKKKLAKERSEKRAQLTELIGKAEQSELEKKSISELRAELAALDEV